MRKTKIIATLGPATDSPKMISELIRHGANVFRLNMSHANHEWVEKTVTTIRSSAKKLKSHVAILMDTQGPAIRTGDLPVPLNLKVGQKFTLSVRGEKSEEEHSVDVNYNHFVKDINIGDIVLVDNGNIHMKVLKKKQNHVECRVLTKGQLGSRRHINLPGVKVSLPALTAKDRKDVALGLNLKVDYIALSFVREANDLKKLKALFKNSPHKPPVIAKIEDQTAIRNLPEIIKEADAIMVARGDLGIEVPYEELPIIQRKIVKGCLRRGKPVIVATHMLESMIDNPMATRAEITDVANAVFEQADAIMLSGETTIGKYPLKCLEVFDRVSQRIERSGGANYHVEADLNTDRDKVVKSAVVLADQLNADSIIVFALTGATARAISWQRPRHTPILAVCNTEEIANNLALYRGVSPMVMKHITAKPEKEIDKAVITLLKKGFIKKGQTTVIVAQAEGRGRRVHSIQMRTIQ